MLRFGPVTLGVEPGRGGAAAAAADAVAHGTAARTRARPPVPARAVSRVNSVRAGERGSRLARRDFLGNIDMIITSPICRWGEPHHPTPSCCVGEEAKTGGRKSRVTGLSAGPK